VAIGINITDSKKALENAHQLTEEFRTLAASMTQIVWTANPDGHVDYYNKRCF
jgi:PAS domain-containing protein